MNARDNYGRNVLHQASQSGNFAMIKWLIDDKGADLNAKCIDGQSIIHIAAKSGNIELLKWLIDKKGANI